MLENKLGLTSSAELAREEERSSKKKAAMLFENHIFDNLEIGMKSICFFLLINQNSNNFFIYSTK